MHLGHWLGLGRVSPTQEANWFTEKAEESVHSSKNTSQLPGLLALSASQFSDYIGAESKKVTDLPAQLEGIGLKEQNFKRRKKLRPTSILDILFFLLLLI